MAQNYEIDIKRFNGQDYDTLLPTPASHASTHQAGGSDPLTLQKGNYGSLSIPTSAYQNASVTRAKLANDALYSPVKKVTVDRNIEIDDLGKTLRPEFSSSGTTFTLTLDAVSSAAFPVGSEIAVCRMYNSNKINIAFSGVIVTYLVGGRLANKDENVTVTVPDVGGMLAIKKMSTDSTYGDYWLITGNAEVVS